jgi:predicted PurR-regulated permease PerM
MPKGTLLLLKAVLIVVAVVLSYELLVLLRDFWIPLAFALVISSILLPVVRRLQKRGLHPTLAIALSLVATIVVLSVPILVLSLQATAFADDFGSIQQNFLAFYDRVLHLVQERFRFTRAEQVAFLSQKLKEGATQLVSLASTTLLATTNIAYLFFIVPIYAFLILSQRQAILRAAQAAFKNADPAFVREVMEKMRRVMVQYMLGILTVMLIVGVVDSLGLWVIGVPHFLFLGAVAAILNLVPYLGIVVVSLFTASYASLYFGDAAYFFLILGLFAIVATADANYITPRIVGRRLQVNSMAAILGVVLAAQVWGIAGMILALPFMGALRTLCENVPGLHAVAILIGEANGKNGKHPKPEKDATQDTVSS